MTPSRDAALRRVVAPAYRLVRSGPRTVVWTEEGINLGNFLYHWMRAFWKQRLGQDAVALRTAAMEPWLPVFPGVADTLLVSRADVRLRDRRETGFFQGWIKDHWTEPVEAFSRAMLDLTTLPIVADPRVDRVVVNVRRGDYFDARHAHRYAFDQVAYLEVAMARSAAVSGPIGRVHVVSDDVAWCREHLRWLDDLVPEVTFASEEPTPYDDFATLASARRLVLTHSSFGYWGAHFSNTLHGDNHQDVVVPWFHDRTIHGGEAYQLNPAWSVVRTIPGGWGPPD